MDRKLTRSSDKKILGVAGGLAEYFDLDPTMVRLALIAMMLLDGTGAIFFTYLAAGFLLPKTSDVVEKYDPDIHVMS